MAWTIRFNASAENELSKLDKKLQKDIVRFLAERIENSDDPKKFGKPLKYQLAGLWCYRVQNSRIICRINDAELLILVIKIGHRKDVYT